MSPRWVGGLRGSRVLFGLQVNRIYLVAWAGGYESPSFQFSTDEQEARERFTEYAEDMKKGDSLDLVSFDTANHTTTIMESR